MDVEGLEFFGPRPCDLARTAFQDYVKCRWPIRVFALDPVTQDQNVADAFARRRETQITMAIGFASGQISGNSLMKFNRTLEWDMSTIALNRTVVAFSHGNDTFGWRFQPRFQSPPVEGNLAAFRQTLFGGPTRDEDMRKRELESGMRECTAIIVMPSFVPYATFDVSTNWYKLTNAKNTEMSMRDTVKLSRSIKAMQQSAAACAQCAHLYRDGEVDRLLRRVDQLDRELPLQTMVAQIPYENTSGGFELFNNGITDLAPELIGFYGQPGINPNGSTKMFLVGDGFSVHDTRLIAGGRQIPFNIISRQLIEVQFPSGLQVLRRNGTGDKKYDEVVDVHIATPYGVGSHLLVPVAKPGGVLAGSATDLQFRPGAEFTIGYKIGTESPNVGKAVLNDHFGFNQNAIVVHLPRTASADSTQNITFYVVNSSRNESVGSFEIKNVPFNARDYEYYITAGELADFVNKGGATRESLKSVMAPYLTYLGNSAGSSTTVTVTARVTDPLNAKVPVLGSFTVTYVKK